MKKLIKSLSLIIVLASIAAVLNTTLADWSGYDYNSGSYVDITSGSLVREGNDIEIYDWGSSEYKDVEVQSISSYGSGTEVEIYDYDTGEYRTIDMD